MGMKCPLHDCKEVPKDGTGFSAHIRAHVLRGEAIFADDERKSITRVPDVPLAIGPYERKKRMDDIKAGRIAAQIHHPSFKGVKAPIGQSTELATTNGHAPVLAKGAFDLSKLSPDQINALRAQLNAGTVVPGQSQEVELVQEHSCPTTRAIDRMKETIVMMQVAEMLEEIPADQMLVMMSQMRRMGSLPTRR